MKLTKREVELMPHIQALVNLRKHELIALTNMSDLYKNDMIPIYHECLDFLTRILNESEKEDEI